MRSKKITISNLLLVSDLLFLSSARFQFFAILSDDMPVRNFVGRLEEEGLFPHTHKVYVFIHHHFEIEWNGKHVINVKVNVDREPPVRLDDDETDSKGATDASSAMSQIIFTYSVEWKETAIKYEDRSKLFANDDSFFPRSLEARV